MDRSPGPSLRRTADLSGLCQRSDGLRNGSDFRLFRGRRQDLHLLPIVGKLFTTIEAYHIGPSLGRGPGSPRTFSRPRETVIFVPTTEEQIDQTHHNTPWQITPRKKPFIIQLLSLSRR